LQLITQHINPIIKKIFVFKHSSLRGTKQSHDVGAGVNLRWFCFVPLCNAHGLFFYMIDR
jgi:hypothetical protein